MNENNRAMNRKDDDASRDTSQGELDCWSEALEFYNIVTSDNYTPVTKVTKERFKEIYEVSYNAISTRQRSDATEARRKILHLPNSPPMHWCRAAILPKKSKASIQVTRQKEILSKMIYKRITGPQHFVLWTSLAAGRPSQQPQCRLRRGDIHTNRGFGRSAHTKICLQPSAGYPRPQDYG